MRDEKFLIFFGLISVLFASSACTKKAEILPSEIPQKTAYAKIEDVDFKNLSYSFGENDAKTFTLANGEKPYAAGDDTSFVLEKIRHADLTEDGQNEAVVDLVYGSGVTTKNLIFIYTLQNGQPKKIWTIFSNAETGGRLKDVYTKENKVIFEIFGKNEFAAEKNEFLYTKDYNPLQAFCCPKNFTKFTFDWNGEKFVLRGNPEVFDYKPDSENNKN